MQHACIVLTYLMGAFAVVSASLAATLVISSVVLLAVVFVIALLTMGLLANAPRRAAPMSRGQLVAFTCGAGLAVAILTALSLSASHPASRAVAGLGLAGAFIGLVVVAHKHRRPTGPRPR